VVTVHWQSVESVSQKIKEYGNFRSVRGYIACGGKSATILEFASAF
jgi:hypothetical protein